MSLTEKYYDRKVKEIDNNNYDYELHAQEIIKNAELENKIKNIEKAIKEAEDIYKIGLYTEVEKERKRVNVYTVLKKCLIPLTFEVTIIIDILDDNYCITFLCNDQKRRAYVNFEELEEYIITYLEELPNKDIQKIKKNGKYVVATMYLSLLGMIYFLTYRIDILFFPLFLVFLLLIYHIATLIFYPKRLIGL